jgi:hypothetical protein
MPSYRPITEIEKDFTDAQASRLPAILIREKLERLWDEANIAASGLLSTALAEPYLGLLKNMEETFQKRDNADRFARRDNFPW